MISILGHFKWEWMKYFYLRVIAGIRNTSISCQTFTIQLRSSPNRRNWNNEECSRNDVSIVLGRRSCTSQRYLCQNDSELINSVSIQFILNSWFLSNIEKKFTNDFQLFNSALRIQKYLKYTCIMLGLIGCIFSGAIFIMKQDSESSPIKVNKVSANSG